MRCGALSVAKRLAGTPVLLYYCFTTHTVVDGGRGGRAKCSSPPLQTGWCSATQRQMWAAAEEEREEVGGVWVVVKQEAEAALQQQHV